MRGLGIRRSGAAALRLLAAAATTTVVVGCTAAVPPAPVASTASPTAAGPRTDPATSRAGGASSAPRVTPTVSAVSLTAFAGSWSGHTRSLTVSASGSGHETVSDGCCTPELDLTFRLSDPRGSAAHPTATATVTAVALDAAPGPALEVGRTGTVSIVDGVLTDSLDGVTYCNRAAAARSACGA